MDLIGQYVGQYRIVEPIGVGGALSVYKAYQEDLDRYAAIKVLPPLHALTSGFRERFAREARAVAQLRHPNILPIYDLSIRDDFCYLVMRYVAGHTLSRAMGEPIELSTVCGYVDQLAAALDHAHAHGVIHGDIRPSHILLEDDSLLLIDFSTAKIVAGSQALSATDATLGSEPYVSPEQAQGKPIDHRNDIYALGVVLREMVTGRAPHTEETPSGVSQKRTGEPPPAPPKLRPDLPEAVERIIHKATAPKADDRYDQAGELAEALRTATAAGQPESPIHPECTETTATHESVPSSPDSSSVPPSTAGVPAQPSVSGRSSPWLTGGRGLALVGVGVLLLITVGTIALFAERPSPDEAPGRPVAGEDSNDDLPTRTPQLTPTSTAQPTDNPVFALTQAALLASDAAITTHNVDQVEEQARLGRGTITALAMSPDGATLAVAGSLGVWLYATDTLETIGLLEGHAKPVADAIWSPDGLRLASASEDGTVRVWLLPGREDRSPGEDAPVTITGTRPTQEALVLRGHVGAVTSMAWSPDGTRLATGGRDDTVRIWRIPAEASFTPDIPGAREAYVLPGHTGAVMDLAWSPDGTLLASASRDSTVRLWRFSGGEDLSTNGTGIGENIAAPSETTVFAGHTEAVRSVAWSPDGTQLASAGEDETIRIWLAPGEEAGDVHAETVERQLSVMVGHVGAVRSVTWSPDGTQLASAGLDSTVRVWPLASISAGDISTGDEHLVLQGHTQPVRDTAWFPNGLQLVSGGDDGTLRVWQLEPGSAGQDTNGATLHTLTGHRGAALSMAWSPDGTQLVAGNRDGTLLIWSAPMEKDEPSTRRLVGHSGEIHSVAWSPNGTSIASASGILDSKVLLWDIESPGAAHVLTGHSSVIVSVAWSPNGTRLASAGWDNTVRLWDATGRPLHALIGHSDWVLSVAWSPDGTHLASGGKDGTIRIWDGDDGEQLTVLDEHTDQVISVAWSPDGSRLASTSRDNTLRIWDVTRAVSGAIGVAPGNPFAGWRTPGPMISVAWSPDGTQLAAGSGSQDTLVRIWDVATGTEVGALEGHVDLVNAVVWSPDGTCLATASEDGTVRIWGLPTER